MRRQRTAVPPSTTERAALCALEEELLKPEVRQSPDQVARLLSDEFVEFGSSGSVFDKAQIIESLRQTTATRDVVLTDFAARRLAPDVVPVTYRTMRTHGTECRLRSSIWKSIEGRRQMIFHQGTPSTASER